MWVYVRWGGGQAGRQADCKASKQAGRHADREERQRHRDGHNNNEENLLSALTPSKGDSKRFTMTTNLNKGKIQEMRICTVHDDENVAEAVWSSVNHRNNS